jgi:hypothetical protein
MTEPDGAGRLSEKGYRVVPAALRNAQKAFAITGDEWDALGKEMAEWTLADGDLGLLGRLAGVVGDYNQSVNEIIGKVQTGAQSLHAAGTALDTVATAYEKQDEKYYAKFGWTEKQMDGVAAPPD